MSESPLWKAKKSDMVTTFPKSRIKIPKGLDCPRLTEVSATNDVDFCKENFEESLNENKVKSFYQIKNKNENKYFDMQNEKLSKKGNKNEASYSYRSYKHYFREKSNSTFLSIENDKLSKLNLDAINDSCSDENIYEEKNLRPSMGRGIWLNKNKPNGHVPNIQNHEYRHNSFNNEKPDKHKEIYPSIGRGVWLSKDKSNGQVHRRTRYAVDNLFNNEKTGKKVIYNTQNKFNVYDSFDDDELWPSIGHDIKLSKNKSDKHIHRPRNLMSELFSDKKIGRQSIKLPLSLGRGQLLTMGKQQPIQMAQCCNSISEFGALPVPGEGFVKESWKSLTTAPIAYQMEQLQVNYELSSCYSSNSDSIPSRSSSINDSRFSLQQSGSSELSLASGSMKNSDVEDDCEWRPMDFTSEVDLLSDSAFPALSLSNRIK